MLGLSDHQLGIVMDAARARVRDLLVYAKRLFVVANCATCRLKWVIGRRGGGFYFGRPCHGRGADCAGRAPQRVP